MAAGFCGVRGEVEEIRDLLSATHDDGTPNLLLRARGIEMWLKEAALGDEGEGDPLLPGVVLRFPVPPHLREVNAAPPEDTESSAAE